jgi:E3 ubiquitin-protein ligase HUWE1
LELLRWLREFQDLDILIAALETLSTLMKNKPIQAAWQWEINLLCLAERRGSKEEGLGLYSCVMANERTQDEGLYLFRSDVENEYEKSHCRVGSTLYLEMHGVNAQSTKENRGNQNASSLAVIQISDLHLQKEDDLSLLKQCIEQYNVPPKLPFSLRHLSQCEG